MASTLHPDHPLYEVRPVRGEEIPWMLKRNIWTGVLGSLSVTFLTNGVFFTAFCQQMGMRHYQFGILATLVSLTLPLSLFSAAIEEWFGQRKYPWFVLCMASRFLLAPLLLGYFVRFNPWIIVALVVGMMSISRLISPLWLSWTWDYIPSDSFGRFTAKRNFWITFWRAGVALGGAFLVHIMPAEHKLQVISVIFTGLLILGIIDLIYHVRIPEPPRETPSSRSLAKFLTALRNKPFRNLLFATGVWYFALFVGSPFCVPYMMEELGFESNFILATLLVYAVPAAGTLLTLPVWGKISDRARPGILMAICCLFWAFIPLFYYYAGPGNALTSLVGAWIIAGIFPAGYAVLQPLLTRRLSGPDKTMPSALLLMVASLGGVAGSTVGTFIVRTHPVNDAFMVSFVARLAGAFVVALLLVYAPLMKRLHSNTSTLRFPDAG